MMSKSQSIEIPAARPSLRTGRTERQGWQGTVIGRNNNNNNNKKKKKKEVKL